MNTVKAYILSVVSAILLTSCSMETAHIFEKPEPMTPLITVAEITVNSEKRAQYDTLYIGDTLQISVALDPFYNTITHFDIDTDRKMVTDSIFSDYDYGTYCDSVLSDKEKGKYVFKGMEPSLGVFVPRMQFVAVKKTTRKTGPVTIGIMLTTDMDTTSLPNHCVRAFSFHVTDRPVPEQETIDEKIDRLIKEEAARMSK